MEDPLLRDQPLESWPKEYRKIGTQLTSAGPSSYHHGTNFGV